MNDDFVKWAMSFSGCDGGNLYGQVWFCGIEWGGEDEHPLKEEIKVPVHDPPQRYNEAGDILRWPNYGVRLIKLITAIRGGRVEDYRSVACAMPFPFERSSDYFKLNLYPIAFASVASRHWESEYRELTGIETLNGYLRWCRQYRFPQIRSWVARGQPKLVVGIGLGERLNYISAFGATDVRGPEKVDNHGSLWRAKINGGRGHLAVTPFLGYQQGSLSTDAQLQAFGVRLGEILSS